jgi:hypothetical protein
VVGTQRTHLDGRNVYAASYDGANVNQMAPHIAYPGSGFKSTSEACPFQFVPWANHTIYLDDENSAAQNYFISGWGE